MRVVRREREAGEQGRTATEPQRRLFLALWPQSSLQVTLAEATRGALLAGGGRPVPPESFHITLAFLGSVPERRLVEVIAIVGRVADETAWPALQFDFDGIEYWKKSKVVCATASSPPPGAVALADTLKSQLHAAGFTPDLKPFRAHITLVRKVLRPIPIPAMNIEPVILNFTAFALVESRTEPEGAVYRVLESFPLAS